ncbi:MAG: TIGR04219 family outer membrane beta-barrel protein [Psychromonas sp.]
MKLKACAALVATTICMPTMADIIEIYAGMDYRNNASSTNIYDLEDSNNLSGYLALEHFVPLIPNAKIKYSDLSSDTSIGSNDVSSSAGNAILYYRLFNNSLLEFDFGLAYTHFESDYDNLSSDLGQLYGATKVHLPGTNLHAFAEVIGGSASSDNYTDAEIGLAYTFNPDSFLNVSVRAGYRYQEAEINKYEQENKGAFAGLEVHF